MFSIKYIRNIARIILNENRGEIMALTTLQQQIVDLRAF